MQRTNPFVKDGRLYPAEIESVSIEVGSPTWYDWLEQHTTFTFAGTVLTYTVRKSMRRSGDSYWKAYRTHHGKL